MDDGEEGRSRALTPGSAPPARSRGERGLPVRPCRVTSPAAQGGIPELLRVCLVTNWFHSEIIAYQDRVRPAGTCAISGSSYLVFARARSGCMVDCCVKCANQIYCSCFGPGCTLWVGITTMSLRSKVVAAIALVFLLLAAISLAIQRFVVYPSFVKLEHDEVVKDAERSVAAVRGELNHLALLTHDWSAWDDTYAYVVDRNSEYEEVNLVSETFVDAELDLIYIFDDAGAVVWGETRSRETGAEMKLETLPWDRPSLESALLNHQSPHSFACGILMTEFGPMLLASYPIVTNDSRGPIRGTMMMGRVIDSEMVDRLVQQTRVDFKIWPVSDRNIPAEGLAALGRISPDDGPIVVERDADMLSVYAVQPGLDRGSDLLIGADVSRAISARGALSTRYAAYSLVLVGIATALILLLVLQRIVVGPISELTKQLTATGDGRESTARIAAQRPDEIGKLAASFNGLLEKLSASQETLMGTIAKGTATVTSADFFPLLVQHLAKVLDVRYAIIAEHANESRSRIRTLAVWAIDHLEENFECDIEDTPCEKVMEGHLTLIQRDLLSRFPDDQRLTDYCADSYCGIPLYGSSGEVIGLLAVLDPEPLNAESEKISTLRIFASRSAAELERMRAEHELRESHSLLKSIIEGTDEGIFLKDIEGRYQLVNPAWARLLGLPDREIIGSTDEEILVVENARILRNKRQTVIAAGDTASSETQLQLNGRTCVLLINTTPFRDTDGMIVGSIGVCRDITKLKQAQQQAQQRLEQLAHIGRLSTMGEMATGIAHEINQPLHAIANFAAAADAQLATLEPLSADELRKLLVQISEQAVRAGEIVRRIRNLARKSRPNPSTVHINKLVREVVNLVRPEMQSKNVQLDLQLGDGLPTVQGDQIQIQQVVLNLLRNAYEAMTGSAQASPEVMVITAPEGDESVRITVRDNGTGLPADEPESIFEAFVTTKHEGMGMGLAISRSIAEAHGGHLWATSNGDSGSSFHFTLHAA